MCFSTMVLKIFQTGQPKLQNHLCLRILIILDLCEIIIDAISDLKAKEIDNSVIFTK